MGMNVEHEIHNRRFGRNLGVGLSLVALAVLVFGLTIAKVSGGGSVEAYDHSLRSSVLPLEGAE